MKYALLIYLPDDHEQRVGEAEDRAVMEKCVELARATRKTGQYQGSARLSPTRNASCVRNQAGKQFVTDGPFAETKEHMVGFYLIECASLEDAQAYARKHPAGEVGATIEIRPVMWADPAMTLQD